MRTATSLLAALALTACGTSNEFNLETDGLSRGIGDGPTSSIDAPTLDLDIAIVTTAGIPRLDDPYFPGATIDPEATEDDEVRDDAPDEPGEAGRSPIDRVFDPDGYCEPEPAERGCPSPHSDKELTETQEQQLGALAMACESWMVRGPASYAMDVTEFHQVPESEETEIRIDATVCTGATVDAFDVGTGDPLDATTVASIDNMFFAAADHVINGEAVEVTIDPNLSYITRMTVITGGEPEPELFEITAALRPIGPVVVD